MENIEREANLFAAHLLITDDMLYDYTGFTKEQFCQCTGYPIELVQLRLHLHPFFKRVRSTHCIIWKIKRLRLIKASIILLLYGLTIQTKLSNQSISTTRIFI